MGSEDNSLVFEDRTVENKINLTPIKAETESIQSTRPQDYKNNFMLNSAEHEVFPAHKC